MKQEMININVNCLAELYFFSNFVKIWETKKLCLTLVKVR